MNIFISITIVVEVFLQTSTKGPAPPGEIDALCAEEEAAAGCENCLEAELNFLILSAVFAIEKLPLLEREAASSGDSKKAGLTPPNSEGKETEIFGPNGVLTRLGVRCNRSPN